jgi:hypothetical protein
LILKIIITLLFIASVSGLQGCVATYSYHPENVRTCKTEAGSEWSGGGTNLRLIQPNASYSFHLTDQGSNNVGSFVKTDMFLVMVYGASFGKLAGMYVPEMLYDPSNAFIEIDGKKILAMPKIWEANLVNGYYGPTKELPAPTNLNVIRPVPQNFFIGFKFDPSPGDTYRIHVGKIILDGKETALPTFLSCYKEGYGKWYPIH